MSDTEEAGSPAAIGLQAKLYTALAKAQGEFLPLAKNRKVTIKTRTGGSYEFRYADLEAVLACSRKALADNGLAVVQLMNAGSLITQLLHSNGGVIESTMEMPVAVKGGDIKDYGAAITYLRRYALTSILCIAADDDLDEDSDHSGEGNPSEGPKKQPESPQVYSQEKFDKNFQSWVDGVKAGKATPEGIVKKIESEVPLTQEQYDKIMAIEVPQQ